MMGPEGEPRLPPGYRLDRSDPDVWTLRRSRGWIVAYFSAGGATKEAIVRTAWKDHEDCREEGHSRLHLPLSRLLVRRWQVSHPDLSRGPPRSGG